MLVYDKRAIVFDYVIPTTLTITMPMLRKALREVQAQLLSRDINGGDKKLNMDTTTTANSCGMAACIGGWASLFLLGFDKTHNNNLEGSADELFSVLIKLDNHYGTGRLNALFHHYRNTPDFDEPNVAATAIKRYLAGSDQPWPRGDMPNVMPYTKRAYRKHK